MTDFRIFWVTRHNQPIKFIQVNYYNHNSCVSISSIQYNTYLIYILLNMYLSIFLSQNSGSIISHVNHLFVSNKKIHLPGPDGGTCSLAIASIFHLIWNHIDSLVRSDKNFYKMKKWEKPIMLFIFIDKISCVSAW